ncbi:MAG: flagellar motor switch protein FliG [Candidatus Hinthialibacter antarcticus]|nr:flagellar motor switch protein FliG [Candidatus Hinthialibacter antarcticus]
MVRGAKEKTKLSGRKKAAILMITLGPDISADVYRCLSDDEIEQITLEVANIGNVPQELIGQVIEEFYHTAMAKQYVSHGGISAAREILEKALGPGKAMEVIERLQGMLQGTPFDFLKKVDPNHLLNFIQSEHPQTVALILAHLEYDQSAVIMSALPPEMQTEVALRIATMDQTSPEIISEVERVLERKIATVLSQEFSVAGGIEALAELLNRVDRATEKSILETLEEENQELAVEIKKLMFTFDDVILLDDRAIQMVLREVDLKELATALKGGNEEVKTKIFSNVSSRAADNIREDMEFMGPVRVKQVEEAQQKIVAIIRRLEESGEIVINRGGADEMMA